MSVKYKGATKRCFYGVCKNDSRRITSKSMESCFFIKFPKPCISYRHGLLDCGKRKHINMCRQRKKSELWVKYCRRADVGLKSIDHVTKDTYICFLHFHGKNGPTEAYPNLIDHAKSNNATIVLKQRSSLAEKYGTTSAQLQKLPSNVHDKAQHFVNDRMDATFCDDGVAMELSNAKEGTCSLGIQTATNVFTCDVGMQTENYTTSASVATETEITKTKSKKIQVTVNYSPPVEQFIDSLKCNNKKCIFYTGLRYLQIIAIFNFLSPACENLTFWGSNVIIRRNKRKNYKLTTMQQLILVLVRLRAGLLVSDLSYRIDLSVGLISKTVITWIQFMYNEFSTHLRPIMFPSRQIISENFRK